MESIVPAARCNYDQSPSHWNQIGVRIDSDQGPTVQRSERFPLSFECKRKKERYTCRSLIPRRTTSSRRFNGGCMLLSFLSTRSRGSHATRSPPSALVRAAFAAVVPPTTDPLALIFPTVPGCARRRRDSPSVMVTALCCKFCTLCYKFCTPCDMLCTLYTVQYGIYFIHCAVWCVPCDLYFYTL